MSDRDAPHVDDRLSGWKEIAHYLRRSVRSVQRWERELGLPVLRTRTKNGQVIYASRTQLDAWLSRNEEHLPPPTAEDVDTPLEAELPETAPATTVDRSSPWRWWPVAAVVGIAVLASVYTFRPRVVHVAETKVVRQQVEARASSGELLWSHDFGRDVSVRRLVGAHLQDVTTDSASIEDLDGDGRAEQLVPIRFSAATEPNASDALFTFSESGAVAWTVRPDDVTLACRGETFAGPWRLTALAVSSGPGEKRVWASFVHHTWWPSFVMEITPSGAAHIKYVQSGWVSSLAEWDSPGGTQLLAGGVINEHARASLVAIDPAQPLTYLASESPAFACAVSGTAPPRAWLFPASEIATAQQLPYALTYQVRALGKRVRVEVDLARMIFEIDASGRVVTAAFSDGFWQEHQAMNRVMTITHVSDFCPVRRQPQEIREWTRGGLWQSYSVAPSDR